MMFDKEAEIIFQFLLKISSTKLIKEITLSPIGYEALYSYIRQWMPSESMVHIYKAAEVAGIKINIATNE